MTTDVSIDSPKQPRFWSRLWRRMVAFEEAMDETEASILAERVDRLEREVSNLNARLSKCGGESRKG